MKLNEYIRFGIGRFFDFLPTISIKWFNDTHGKRHFDLFVSWFCFYSQTTNFGRCCIREMEQQKHAFTYRVKPCDACVWQNDEQMCQQCTNKSKWMYNDENEKTKY